MKIRSTLSSLAASAAAAALIVPLACLSARAQDGPLADQGRGLPPAHPFVSDPSGGFSRVLFQSSDDPNFNVTIRDYSFPPDKQARSVTLPAGALLQLLSDAPAVSVAKQPVEAAAAAIVAVPAGAPVE